MNLSKIESLSSTRDGRRNALFRKKVSPEDIETTIGNIRALMQYSKMLSDRLEDTKMFADSVDVVVLHLLEDALEQPDASADADVGNRDIDYDDADGDVGPGGSTADAGTSPSDTNFKLRSGGGPHGTATSEISEYGIPILQGHGVSSSSAVSAGNGGIGADGMPLSPEEAAEAEREKMISRRSAARSLWRQASVYSNASMNRQLQFAQLQTQMTLATCGGIVEEEDEDNFDQTVDMREAGGGDQAG